MTRGGKSTLTTPEMPMTQPILGQIGGNFQLRVA
jgi:hypothetical protein